jgi:hypothetical protein
VILYLKPYSYCTICSILYLKLYCLLPFVFDVVKESRLKAEVFPPAAIRINTSAGYLVLLVLYLLDEPKIGVATLKLMDRLVVQQAVADLGVHNFVLMAPIMKLLISDNVIVRTTLHNLRRRLFQVKEI